MALVEEHKPMADKDIALMAHLMRRAGFGATREELEERVAKGYEATVEDLLHHETAPPADDSILFRHQPGSSLLVAPLLWVTLTGCITCSILGDL